MLQQRSPELAREFNEAKRAAEGWSHFVRRSERFPLTAVGDVNVYPLFAEVDRSLLDSTGKPGSSSKSDIAPLTAIKHS